MLTSIPWDGKPISVPGCYSGIPLDTYHSADICGHLVDGEYVTDPSISSTGLRTIYMRSPAHYWDNSPYNPDREPPDPAAREEEWKTFGRASHHLLIGGVENFREAYVIQPDWYPKNPEEADKVWGKNPLDKTVPHGWSEEHAGKKWDNKITFCKRWGIKKRTAGITVLTNNQVKTIERMAMSLDADPSVRPYDQGGNGILDGWIERSLFWKDPETGIWLRIRPDAIPTSCADVADLKTTQSVIWPDLVYTIESLGYCQQGALIGEGLKAIFDMDMATFSLVFVEKKRPHCVRVAPIDSNDLLRGQLQNRVAIRKFANCIDRLATLTPDIVNPTSLRALWPGPAGEDRSGDVATLSLSVAARERADKRLKFEGMIT